MSRTRVLQLRSLAVLASAALLQGCGCDAWGCINGLFVQLDKVPTIGYRVELFVDGALQEADGGALCDPIEPCKYQYARYSVLPTKNVSVRVTTSSGSRTTNFDQINYVGKSGYFDCHDCKGQAYIVANAP